MILLAKNCTDRGTIVEKDKVQATTPIASTLTQDGKFHVFYVDKSNMIVHCTDGTKNEQLVQFYPGSKLGATSVENKITLFYRNLNPVGEVGTLENQNGEWKRGTTVIRA